MGRNNIKKNDFLAANSQHISFMQLSSKENMQLSSKENMEFKRLSSKKKFQKVFCSACDSPKNKTKA